MNDSLPRASAVLVQDGLILEVGEPENMGPWLRDQDYVEDDQFAEKIICPGFIDPHLHPSRAAVLLPMEFITAMRWKLPWGVVEPTTSAQEFDDRMAELNSKKASGAPLFIWGYHLLWHGGMDRKRIESVVGKTPTIVCHRSLLGLVFIGRDQKELPTVGPNASQIKQVF